MTKNFLAILAAGLALVGGLVWYAVHANQAHLLTLKGTVLKVRTLAFGPSAALAIVDFRVTNPSGVGFSVQDVELEMEPMGADSKGDAKAKSEPRPIPGGLIEQRELARIFEYEPKVGSKEHERIAAGDSIGAGQTKDFMVAARFEVPQADVDGRAHFTIRLHDFNGPVVEIGEAQPAH